MNENMEKRRHERVKSHIPVRYRKLRGGGVGIIDASSISNNLSQGGIRFRTGEFISMACRLILELDIPMLTKPIKAISKVAWIKKAESSDDYVVGSQFLEISKQDKEYISKYVSSLNLYNDPEVVEATASESE